MHGMMENGKMNGIFFDGEYLMPLEINGSQIF